MERHTKLKKPRLNFLKRGFALYAEHDSMRAWREISRGGFARSVYKLRGDHAQGQVTSDDAEVRQKFCASNGVRTRATRSP